MENSFYTPDFSFFKNPADDNAEKVEVSKPEFDLLKSGDEIMKKAFAREQRQTPEGLTVPAIFYDDLQSDSEKNIVRAAAAVKESYQKERQEGVPLKFVPRPDEPLATGLPALHDVIPPVQPFAPQLYDTQGQGLLSGTVYMNSESWKGPVKVLPILPGQNINYAELAELMKQRMCLKRYKGEVYYYNEGIYQKLSNEEMNTKVCTALREEIDRIGRSWTMKEVATFLKADERLDDVPFINPLFLCLENGILDLSHGKLLEHSPQYFFTSRLNVSLWDIAEESTPVFDCFLHQVTGGDSVLRQRMLETMGYIFTTDMNAKVFIFIQGVGNSGKSVFGQLLSNFFAPEVISNLDVFKMSERFAGQALTGKRLNISMDLPSGRLHESAVGMIKMLTGNDGIAVEKKYGEITSYNCECKLIFGSNHPIQLTRQDPAFTDRVLLLPFQYPIPAERQVKNLIALLREENRGILKQALRAYLDLVRNNYVFTGGHLEMQPMALPAAVVPLEDLMLQWIVAWCCQAGKDVFTTTEKLRQGFMMFYQQRTGGSYTVDSASFSRMFHRLAPWAEGGKKRVEEGNLNGYYGVTMNLQC